MTLNNPRTESEYQLRLKDNQYQEESNLKGKQFSSQISDLRQNIHKLNNDIETNKKNQDNANTKHKESNEKGIVKISTQIYESVIHPSSRC